MSGRSLGDPPRPGPRMPDPLGATHEDLHEPMLPPVLLQGRQPAIPGIAASLKVSANEGQALAGVLEAMMRNDLAPWLPLLPEARDRWVHALGQAVPRPEIADLLLRGFAEVQTGQDPRGFGVMTGTALSGAVGPRRSYACDASLPITEPVAQFSGVRSAAPAPRGL